MDAVELFSFLDWLERNQRTVLAREDQMFDGENESYTLSERYYTLTDVEEWLTQWREDQ